ncbi:MAG TPA: chemotaxis protein CheW [Hyphomicrobium sp.]|nr:chemotaxis protein CheW [Hyphomicrobium sp.]
MYQRAKPDGQTFPSTEFVTVYVGDQVFGLPIGCVQDVFHVGAITPVPLAPYEVAGLLNLRGRVLTALCLRRLLRLPAAPEINRMVVGIEQSGESFGLLVDKVGEVLSLPIAERQPAPSNFDPRWARFASGVYWLAEGLLVVLDVEAALSQPASAGPRQASYFNEVQVFQKGIGS